jgi:GNAT superfamily N-acetyltransferase
MGLEHSSDAALLRHAYILPEHQHHGIGLRLAEHLERVAVREGASRSVRRIIVGTCGTTRPGARWRRQAGYRLSEDSAAILLAYYAIRDDRLRASVTYEKPV